MKLRFVKSLQYVFLLLAAFALLYFVFRGVDLDELILQIRHANYSWVALSIPLTILASVFRALRWRMLIEPLNEQPALINIFHAVNIGYLANFVFPRIGEITRCGILNRTDRITVDRLLGTVIVERIFDMLMTVLMICVILLLRFDTVSSFISEHILLPLVSRMSEPSGISRMIIIIALMLPVLFVFYKMFKTQLSKISALRKIKYLLQGIINGIKSVYRMRNIGMFTVLNCLIFGMYFLQTYVMFFALEGTSTLGPVDALFILVLCTLAFIIPVQGGIGAFHWIVSTGLTVFGLTREEGMAYATISHSVSSIILILLGVISLIYVFLGKKLKNNKPV